MHLYIDCRAGLSGDMFLAALTHLGLDLKPLEDIFRKAGVEVSLSLRRENRESGQGLGLNVSWPGGQPLRHLPDIVHILERLDCAAAVRERSTQAFHELARAEAHVHGCAVEEIHFHEVGAIDTLVDVVGAFWGIEQLGIASASASPLPWFTGTVTCEHGVISLPAPATLELMAGMPVFPSGAEEELVTPTGALILASVLRHYAPMGSGFQEPEGVFLRSGTGYGTRPSGRGLRLALLETGRNKSGDRVAVLESHLDHLTGEELGHAMEALMEAGALDVLWMPGLMKKGRPGGALRVLCREGEEEALALAFFRHTHTLGIRHCLMERYLLPRFEEECLVRNATLKGKAYTVAGKTFVRPEYEALKLLAEKKAQTLPELRFEEKES